MTVSKKVPLKNPKKRDKREKENRMSYTPETKQQATKYYLLGLSLAEISILMSIPVRTLEKWQLSNNWFSLKDPVKVKEKVLQLRQAGKTIKEIAFIFKKSEKTVIRWTKEAKESRETNKG